MAGITWFDEAPDGAPFARFSDLAGAYSQFMGQDHSTIDFNALAVGSALAGQYSTSHGVTFSNTALGGLAGYSRVRSEGDGIVEHLTGYDGSYMPHGDHVFVKFDNEFDATPFTMTFEQPVARVGAFIGTGVQGAVHSVRISAFDASGTLLSHHIAEPALWDATSSKQNYESFFGIRADGPRISRVEIVNLATTRYANALLIDNIAFSAADPVPEPGTWAMCATGAVLTVARRRASRCG
jgi:hypothetical protein